MQPTSSPPQPFTTSLFEHLLEVNARLAHVLDVPPGESPEAEALAGLFETRAALLRTLQEAAQPPPEELRALLVEQHHHVDALLKRRARETSEHLQRIEQFERAQARYSTAAPRRVLRTSLNI